MTYTVPKKVFSKNSAISKMEIHFLNGDFVTIRKNEICNISITFYDALLRHKKQLYSVARSGFVKLKIQDGRAKWEDRSLHDEKKYNLQRKEYIERRCLCLDKIKFIILYNENGCSDLIFGDICVVEEGTYIFLKFKPNDSFGSWESTEHFVELSHPSKKQIFKMRLDFENCDGIDVYNSEILDMNLVFNKKLEWNGPGYIRSVKGGRIIIKLAKEYESRYSDIWTNGKRVTLKRIENRICGKKRESVDICNLYLDFYGCYDLSGEHIGVDSLYKTAEDNGLDDYDEFDDYYDSLDDDSYNDNDGYDDDYDDYDDVFESGFAEKLENGTIVIVFGKK